MTWLSSWQITWRQLLVHHRHEGVVVLLTDYLASVIRSWMSSWTWKITWRQLWVLQKPSGRGCPADRLPGVSYQIADVQLNNYLASALSPAKPPGRGCQADRLPGVSCESCKRNQDVEVQLTDYLASAVSPSKATRTWPSCQQITWRQSSDRGCPAEPKRLPGVSCESCKSHQIVDVKLTDYLASASSPAKAIRTWLSSWQITWRQIWVGTAKATRNQDVIVLLIDYLAYVMSSAKAMRTWSSN